MRKSLGIVSLTFALLLSGCSGAMVFPGGSSTEVKGAPIQGRVIGGQNGINGAEVFLYAAPTTGYGAASTSLLKSPGYVTTATDGTFAITGDYTCPTATPNEQVYLYAVGGNPGSGANSAAGLMAAIGPCPSAGTLSSSLYIALNEISTVATAYAIAGFATDATHVSTGTTALASTDLANAFSSATNLETLGTGFALSTTPGGNGTVPASTINTLADILSACINSTGPTSTACTTLFSNAENSSSVKPTDTATAAINIAHNPGANVATLYGLLPTTGAPFVPTLAAPGPNDWTISIVYSGGGIDYSAGVAIDKSGNVWTTDYSDNSISEFNTLGVPASSTGYTDAQLNGPGGIAIDSTGNVWTTNYGGSTLSEYVPGTGFNGTGFTGGGLTSPTWISIDKFGNLWVTNTATMSEFTSAGVARTTATGLTTGGLSGPQFSAADTAGNVWVANDDSGAGTTLSEFTSSATALATANASSPRSGGGLEGPFGLAIDASGNIWAGDWGNNDLSEFTSAGSAVSGSPYNPHGGLSEPEEIAIDGAGMIWAVNNGGNNLSEYNSTVTALSPSTGYTSSLLTEPEMLAIDGSGNIWIPDKGGIGLTEFVGAAAPVVTPIVANLLTPYGTKAVNKP